MEVGKSPVTTCRYEAAAQGCSGLLASATPKARPLWVSEKEQKSVAPATRYPGGTPNRPALATNPFVPNGIWTA